jgi:hypothetical protein
MVGRILFSFKDIAAVSPSQREHKKTKTRNGNLSANKIPGSFTPPRPERSDEAGRKGATAGGGDETLFFLLYFSPL